MLGRTRKAKRKPDTGYQALVSVAGMRMQDQRAREQREALARNARRVMEAAVALDPAELIAPTDEQLATVAGSAVERAMGVRPGSVRASRNGSTTVFILGGELVDPMRKDGTP